MDEDISIIDTRTRNEKIKNFFIKNKKNLIIISLFIISLIFGYFIFEDLKKKNKIKLGNKYNLVSINFISQNVANTKKELIEIINAKDQTYSPLALYFLIDNNILTSQDQINPLFDILITDTKLDDEIKNLIIYKKALFNSDFETENNLLKMLNPILNSSSIWKSHALHLMAEYFFSKKEKQKSKQFFEQILNLENSNPKIKLSAQQRIQRDFSE